MAFIPDVAVGRDRRQMGAKNARMNGQFQDESSNPSSNKYKTLHDNKADSHFFAEQHDGKKMDHQRRNHINIIIIFELVTATLRRTATGACCRLPLADL
jgi:hypothetical protein